MGFFKRLLGLEPNLTKLLSADIIADEDHRYFVSFHKHHPDLQLPEYARILLHYYAKMLFNLDPLDADAAVAGHHLVDGMEMVLGEGVSKDSNILRAADIDDVAAIVQSPPKNTPRRIIATLYFVNVTMRHITTDIPSNIYLQQTVFSVFVLLQRVLDEIDEETATILEAALRKATDAYQTGSYSELQELSTVPNTAYLNAVMGD